MTTAQVVPRPVIDFDAETHAYSVNGKKYLSVTQILKSCGLTADFSLVKPAVLEHKRAVGVAVHQATHYLDEGDLDLSTIDPLVAPYVRAYEQFKREAGFTPHYLETRVWNPTWNYCGTFDRLGMTSDGWQVLLDLKCGNPEDAAAGLQLAGYQDAYERFPLPMPGHKGLLRWAVWLREDATYRSIAYRDHRDLGLWRACVQVANFKEFGR